MDPGGLREVPEVFRVRGQDVVPVPRQADDRRVDRVRSSAAGQQRSRAASKRIIERDDVYPGQQPAAGACLPLPPRHTWPTTPPLVTAPAR